METRENYKNNSVLTTIELNPLQLFYLFGFKPYVDSVYLSCKLLRNGFTLDQVYQRYLCIEKSPINFLTVKKSLDVLSATKFIRKANSGKYYLAQESYIINIHKRLLQKNFYNSKINIEKYCLLYFNKESKEPNLRSYIWGNLISKFWKDMPVTYFEIEKTFGLKKHFIKGLKDIIRNKKYLNHHKSEYSAFIFTKHNVITLGCTYTNENDTITTKINNYIKEDYNIIENKNILENEGSYRSELKKRTLSKIHRTLPSPLISEKKHLFRKLSKTNLSFFTDFKKKFITELSENYLIYQMKIGNPILSF